MNNTNLDLVKKLMVSVIPEFTINKVVNSEFDYYLPYGVSFTEKFKKEGVSFITWDKKSAKKYRQILKKNNVKSETDIITSVEFFEDGSLRDLEICSFIEDSDLARGDMLFQHARNSLTPMCSKKYHMLRSPEFGYIQILTSNLNFLLLRANIKNGKILSNLKVATVEDDLFLIPEECDEYKLALDHYNQLGGANFVKPANMKFGETFIGSDIFSRVFIGEEYSYLHYQWQSGGYRIIHKKLPALYRSRYHKDAMNFQKMDISEFASIETSASSLLKSKIKIHTFSKSDIDNFFLSLRDKQLIKTSGASTYSFYEYFSMPSTISFGKTIKMHEKMFDQAIKTLKNSGSGIVVLTKDKLYDKDGKEICDIEVTKTMEL